jgi:HEAT repeat protein
MRVRLDVVEALGLGGDPAALGILEPVMKDHDPQVARAAERAAARLRRAQRTQR